MLGVACKRKSCVIQASKEGAHLGSRRGQLTHFFLVNLSKDPPKGR